MATKLALLAVVAFLTVACSSAQKLTPIPSPSPLCPSQPKVTCECNCNCDNDQDSAASDQGRRLWTPLVKTRLGYVDVQTTGTQAFHIPATVPTTAEEVLLFADVLVGYTSPGVHSHVKIYTTHKGVHYAKYMSLHTYGQNALYVNSDNIWLPLFANRTIYVKVPNRHNQRNMQLTIDIIGYR